MSTHWSARRLLRALMVPLVLAGVASGLGPAAAASAARCQALTGALPPSPGTVSNGLKGVTVLSRCDGWAVGFHMDQGQATQTLAEHWNGAAWTVIPSPSPGTAASALLAVSADSSTDVWAVGSFTSTGSGTLPLIERWDGHAWSAFITPITANSQLFGVRAISAKDVWAVGRVTSGAGAQTLTLHWNGTSWARKTSPSPGGTAGISNLVAVTATSSTDVWAVGSFTDDTTNLRTLILHWNGTSWARKASPSTGTVSTANFLTGVAATSARDAWAVGFAGGTGRTLILRWNGTAWSKVTSPNPGGGGDALAGVAATSARDAWAVGHSGSGMTSRTLLLHWDGTAWAPVPTPSPGTDASLAAVAATSTTNVWGVGQFDTGAPPTQALTLHCC